MPFTPEAAISAQADLHHQYLLGLQLMVSARKGPAVIGDWMFRLFRRQHQAKFLSSLRKLGLGGLPDAVACARYHVLSNSIGGVAVEYMEEGPRKAWVRFRYPRWMYHGPAICGIPVEASRGFLNGWYAQNGVSLGNPRLGFVCVSEDMTSQFGLCGYFMEYDHDLAPEDRLRFASDERPPPYEPAAQPVPPADQWDPARLAKAGRNYAVDFVQNGLVTLSAAIGDDEATALAAEAARLTGLQAWRSMSDAVDSKDGGPGEAALLLERMFIGIGDSVERDAAIIKQSGLRILKDVEADHLKAVLTPWIELWRGAVHAHRNFMDLDVDYRDDQLIWTVRPA
ncbi:MAG: hypothetical protein AAGJ28_12495 [Pseudomonadota bacterium]